MATRSKRYETRRLGPQTLQLPTKKILIVGRVKGRSDALEFRIDRSIVAQQIRELLDSLVAAAQDLILVSEESVFDPFLSKRLRRAAQSLKETASQLTTLRKNVIKAKQPRL